jgi:hypothetical protein
MKHSPIQLHVVPREEFVGPRLPIGRVTLPSKPIDLHNGTGDRWKRTDLRETFRLAREALGR